MYKINLSEEDKQKALERFTAELNNAKGIENIKFSYNFKREAVKDVEKTTLYIHEHAFVKMAIYLMKNSTEIAWHGCAYRGPKDEGYNLIDVMLYPQIVAGTTVTTDQEKYQNWVMQQPDSIFNNLRMQGHSHVNMGTTPSGVDTTYYENILQTLSKDDFYIFMICNKSLSINCIIYDLKKNIVYETKDINIIIYSNEGENIGKQYTEQFEKLIKEEKKYSTYNSIKNNTPTYGTYYPGYYYSPYSGEKYNKTKEIEEIEEDDRQINLDEYFEEIDKKYEKRKSKSKGGKK